mgnify:CR=1 FL=1
MKIESQIDSRWVWRPLLIAVLLLGWGAYSVYDGFIAYPAHNEQVAKFKEFEQAGDLEQWPDYAREQGWSEEKPAAVHSSTDVLKARRFSSSWACSSSSVSSVSVSVARSFS